MRKLFLVNVGIVAIACMAVLLPACKKKIVHETHPTPDNNRIQAYTKFTTPLVGPALNETYRFYYNGDNHVTEIAYTANQASGMNQLRMLFTYTNDTIIKRTVQVQTSLLLETDTFIIDRGKWQVKEAFFPGYHVKYEYFGKLIARETRTYSSGQIEVDRTMTYTSNNGDLINKSFDGKLNARFLDLTPPIRTQWIWNSPSVTVDAHTTTNTQTLEGYSGYGFSLSAIDTNGDIDTPLVVSDPAFTREEYKVYPDLDFRPGDLFQIESFTTYGISVYANDHLFRNVYGTGKIPGLIDIQYTIDADSKITQTYVTGYGYFAASSIIYKFQWERF